MTQVIRRSAAAAAILVALIGFGPGSSVVSGTQTPKASANFGFEFCAGFGAGFTGGWVQGAVGVRGCIGVGGNYRPLVWNGGQPYIPYGAPYVDYPQQWGGPISPMRWAPPCPPQGPPPWVGLPPWVPPPPQEPPWGGRPPWGPPQGPPGHPGPDIPYPLPGPVGSPPGQMYY